MTTRDPLLERLRRLPRPALDDVAAARSLARAEAAFAAAPRTENAPRSGLARWTGGSLPAALALWGILYSWGAVREIGRLFPAAPAEPAVAARHRGPLDLAARDLAARDFGGRVQFMLNAINKASASTTATTIITPPLRDPLPAAVPSAATVWSEVSSDMDPSMQMVVCGSRTLNEARLTFGADRDTFAAPTAEPTARTPIRSRARAPSGWGSRRSGA
jgi:hypothetical protein